MKRSPAHSICVRAYRRIRGSQEEQGQRVRLVRLAQLDLQVPPVRQALRVSRDQQGLLDLRELIAPSLVQRGLRGQQAQRVQPVSQALWGLLVAMGTMATTASEDLRVLMA